MDESRRLTGAGAPEDRLDRALAHLLAAPALPATLTARVRAAAARDDAAEIARRRRTLEREWEVLSMRFDATRQRLGLTTAVVLTGSTIVSSAALVAALPWVRATFGADGLVLLAWLGAAIGVIAAAGGAGRLHLDT